MKKITLNSGLELEIDEEAMNDMELLDLLVEADDGNVLATSKAATMLLGKEQKTALYNSLRTEGGRVPADGFFKALGEIFGKLGESGKN